MVGFSWDAADEKAMQATFRIGRAQAFGRFLDLQQVRSSVNIFTPKAFVLATAAHVKPFE